LARDREIRFTLGFRTTITITGKRLRGQKAGGAQSRQRYRGLEFGKSTTPGAGGAGRWNEGVGEHVRTRFHFGAFAPVKLRTPQEIRTERRKPVSSAGSVWEELALPKCDPAV
jgi:hypothetical protein